MTIEGQTAKFVNMHTLWDEPRRNETDEPWVGSDNWWWHNRCVTLLAVNQRTLTCFARASPLCFEWDTGGVGIFIYLYLIIRYRWCVDYRISTLRFLVFQLVGCNLGPEARWYVRLVYLRVHLIGIEPRLWTICDNALCVPSTQESSANERGVVFGRRPDLSPSRRRSRKAIRLLRIYVTVKALSLTGSSMPTSRVMTRVPCFRGLFLIVLGDAFSVFIFLSWFGVFWCLLWVYSRNEAPHWKIKRVSLPSF